MGSYQPSLYRFIEVDRVGRFPVYGHKDACRGMPLPVEAGTGHDGVAIALQVVVRFISYIYIY